MSKNDRLRELREAKFKQDHAPIRGIKPEAKRPVKVKGKTVAIAAKPPVPELQALVEEVKVKVKLSSHPDCAECARRREQTRLRVKKARAKQ